MRAGRLIRLRLRADGASEAEAEVRRMCEELIANPVIEDYEVRVAPARATDGGGPEGSGGEAGRG